MRTKIRKGGAEMAHYKLYKTRKIHNLREMLEESAALYRGKPAFYQKKDGKYKSYSFNRFKADVDAFGTALTAKGFAGKRVIVMGENCSSFFGRNQHFLDEHLAATVAHQII